MFKNYISFKSGPMNSISCKLSIKDLYYLYNNQPPLNNKNVNLIDFCVILYIFHKDKKIKSLDILFIQLIFFQKTFNITKLPLILNFNYFFSKYVFVSKDYNFIDKIIKVKFFSFFKKCKKLKKPLTDNNYDKHIIYLWEIKLKAYSDLKFLSKVNLFYITQSFQKINNLVIITSSNLNIPKYSSSSINKYIKPNTLNLFECQFLRKNKVYNKGRYSRCRQNYRTGVYMCLYLSIVSIFGLYYSFYKFSFNFTYLWALFILFLGSFFLPKIIKYRLYEPRTLLVKIFSIFKWIFLIIYSIFKV